MGVGQKLSVLLGIGLAINHTSYNLQSARVFPTSFELSALPLAVLTGTSRNLITNELVYPFIVSNAADIDRTTSADLVLAFHPLGGDDTVLDPYVKAFGGYGRTKADGFQVVRYGGAVGLRLFIVEWFYVVSEVSYANNEISGEVDTSVGLFESTSEFAGNLREVQGQLGFGFAF